MQVVFFWLLILELPLWNIRYGFPTLPLLKEAGKCVAAVFAGAAYLKLLRFEFSFLLLPCMHIKAFTFIQKCYEEVLS